MPLVRVKDEGATLLEESKEDLIEALLEARRDSENHAQRVHRLEHAITAAVHWLDLIESHLLDQGFREQAIAMVRYNLKIQKDQA